MPRLVPIAGAPAGAVTLEGRPLRIGSDPSSDVVLQDPHASPEHAVVLVRPDGVHVRDDRSREGTFVNGALVRGEARLRQGDILRTGGWTARFEDDAPTDEPFHFAVVERGTRRTATGTVATIGRRFGCTIALRDSRVSRLHATIAWRDGRFWITDEGSVNGTFVGRRRVVEQPLEDGDEVTIGGTPGDPGRHRLSVDVAGGVCTITVIPGRTAGEPGSAELTRPFGLRLDLEAPSPEDPAGATSPPARAEAPPPTEPPIVRPPVRGKAKHRGGAWVSTADVSRTPWLRRGAVSLTLLLFAAGLGAMYAGRPEWIAEGGLGPGHVGARFRAQARSSDVCAACHVPWHGVADRACVACHRLGTAGSHGKLGLSCQSCHPEHAPPPADGARIERHRCTDCHGRSHFKAPPPAPGELAPKVFLNKVVSAALVHADHRRLKCRKCHASEEDEKKGRVTRGCDVCHGGKDGMASARCLTCHRYHERKEPDAEPLALPGGMMPGSILPGGVTPGGGTGGSAP